VQWQDGLGSWHDVEGWVGAINNENQVTWTVLAAERGSGPYRWRVYSAAEGDLIATSDPFYATWPLGNIAWVQVPASATAAPGPGAGMRMRVRPPEGEWLWLASAPDEGRTVAWLKAGRVVTIMGGRRRTRTATAGCRCEPRAGGSAGAVSQSMARRRWRRWGWR